MAGLLDFLNTPQGQALASGVATYAATARRGTPINNLGRGFLGGITGYQNATNSQNEAKDNAFTQQYRNAQMQYLTDKIENDRRRLDQQNRNRRDEAESGARMMKALYGGDFSIDDNGEDWQIMPVANTSQGVPGTSENGQLGIDFGNYNRGNAKMFGLSDEDMQSIAQIGQYDQKTAMRMLNDAFKQRLRRNIGGDKLSNFQFDTEGNPWAFNPATGSYMQVPGGFKKAKPSALVDMRGANFGGNLADPGEARKVAGKEFGKFAVEATQLANNAYDNAADVNMIVEGMRGMGGGPIAEFKGFIGKYFPADSDWGRMASMGELAKTVQTKLAPQMRMVGSGSTSDMEMRAYMASIPTLATTEAGRELMAKYHQRVYERAQIRAEVINEIEQSGQLPTPKMIRERMKTRIGDQFFDAADRAYFGLGKQPMSAKPTMPQKTQQKGGVKFLGFE